LCKTSWLDQNLSNLDLSQLRPKRRCFDNQGR